MKTYTRIAAAALVGIAITMSVLHMREPASMAPDTVATLTDNDGDDPVRAELRRCQTLGAAAAEDQRCLNAWATQRSRFFRSSVSHYPQLKSAPVPQVQDIPDSEADGTDTGAATSSEDR